MNYQEPTFPAVFTGNQESLRPFDKDLITSLDAQSRNIKEILDKGVRLQDNVDCDIVSFTSSATPDAENAVAHGLGRVPDYFVVADLNKGAVVYRGTTAWTKTTVYVKASAASAAVKLILL